MAILHARGAGRYAGQAAKAAVDVLDHRLKLNAPFKLLLHEDNAAAQRIVLVAQHLVGWTGGEAEAAVDACLHGVRHGFTLRAQCGNGDFVLHKRQLQRVGIEERAGAATKARSPL